MPSAPLWMPYCGAAPVPSDLWQRWNWDPAVGVSILFVVIVAWRGDPIQRRYGLIAGGLCALLFVSPFCALTSALFSARALHHVVLVGIIAPLFAAAWKGVVYGRLSAWVGIHVAIFWLWHAPPVYAVALSNDAIYWLMQATMMGSAYGFWLAVQRASAPGAIAGLLVAMVQMGLLGALLTFSSEPFYAPHFLGPQSWGLTPLEDQQLAGLIMWVPAAALYLFAALFVALRLMSGEPAETRQ